ncbi:MAG TPA: GNAT family N-acetyltransferase [Methylophilaceae bacterium]|nr:GNAT family N-acetyltransferase [Methylophilaceae bacterium]
MEIISEGYATAQLHPWNDSRTPKHMQEKLRMLTNLYVPEEHRRQGYATALLNKVAVMADRDQLTIVLEAAHHETETEILLDLYGKNGYQKLQDEPLLLVRFPKVEVSMPMPKTIDLAVAAATNRSLH